MTKSMIISIAVVGIIIVGGVVWKLAETPAPEGAQNTTEETNNVSENTENAPAKKMAFGDFLKTGGAYECNVTQYIDAGMSSTTTGKIFLNDGKIRGDYSTSTQGLNIDISLIVRDGYTYTWTSMSSVGQKVAVNPSDTNSDSTAGASGNFNFDTKMIGDYDCQPWTVDNSVFALPGSITFQEFKQN